MSLASIDRYDRDVLSRLARAGEAVRTKDLQDYYRQSGVRNPAKIKQRMKDLEAAGLLEDVGPWRWAYAGPEQVEVSA